MLFTSSVRSWLGNAALACLLFASTVPTAAAAQNQKPFIIKTPMLGSSSNTSSGSKPIADKLLLTPNSLKTNSANISQSKTQYSIPHRQVKTVAVTSHFGYPTQAVKPLPRQVHLTGASNNVSRSNSSRSGLLDHALSLMGIPYVFGGTTRRGFDCSGYSQYVFRGSGIYLPRTAEEQFDMGTSVKREQLQAGDLVFFSTYASGASHVGIYLGGGQFVSASNRGVSISSLSSGYYARRYIGARRIL